METQLKDVADALAAIDGIEVFACDGEGHPIPDADACLHVKCTLSSPQREELLGRIGPVVRRAKFVMAALIDRRDLYSVSYRAPKRKPDLPGSAAKLAELLRDSAALDSGEVPDRRGR